ncbi:hypothetical protein [Paenibacillus macerans]|uniref:hypothetical protein n=1 Tax=Paenibacillus macerans TaxID=44252 RepID=UPI0020415438|nr:hypothetical protein [Paenibacillus macerans]MCM3697785.1 hypothetical protein [Paenibacillus macerans]
MQTTKSYAALADRGTYETFRALVKAIIPGTPVLGPLQAPGAAELYVHEYLIWELDHTLALMFGISRTDFPLSASTARMLNTGAVQFVAGGGAPDAPQVPVWAVSPFSALAPADRIRVLALLEQLRFDLGLLPPPYRDDGGFLKFIIDYLNRGTMFGNYSEWSAYGTTRLDTPTRRKLEHFPIGWRQAGYPSVSSGYRAFRGFMLFIARHEGGYEIVRR